MRRRRGCFRRSPQSWYFTLCHAHSVTLPDLSISLKLAAIPVGIDMYDQKLEFRLHSEFLGSIRTFDFVCSSVAAPVPCGSCHITSSYFLLY
ncbi:hypothetical protein PENSPDRAFT_371714 [Peniophora sp. CONT]|nr:hypothetical protein PENSPDRAFT_371714 [Peniophora sp. CONT]